MPLLSPLLPKIRDKFSLILMLLTITTSTYAAPPEIKTIKILCLGDSLTDGYGVARDNSWPTVAQNIAQKQGYTNAIFINAGISGSTSASGISRLKWHLKGDNKPQILILALGANDGLRGTLPAATRSNLEAVIKLAKEQNITTVLAGVQMPTNYGPQYTQEFANIFPDLAKTYGLLLIPFLLEGVAMKKHLNQNDGIHPNEEGHKIIAQNIINHILPLLGQPAKMP